MDNKKGEDDPRHTFMSMVVACAVHNFFGDCDILFEDDPRVQLGNGVQRPTPGLYNALGLKPSIVTRRVGQCKDLYHQYALAGWSTVATVVEIGCPVFWVSEV